MTASLGRRDTPIHSRVSEHIALAYSGGVKGPQYKAVAKVPGPAQWLQGGCLPVSSLQLDAVVLSFRMAGAQLEYLLQSKG